MHVQNRGITDKLGFLHTCYVATATQNLKYFRNSSPWTCSYLMALLRSQNKNTDVLIILALLCRFEQYNTIYLSIPTTDILNGR